MADLPLPWKSRAKNCEPVEQSPVAHPNNKQFNVHDLKITHVDVHPTGSHRVLYLKSPFHVPNPFFMVYPRLLLDVDDYDYGGVPCSVGETTVLDFMVGVHADFVTEQIKATPIIESILETVPLYVDVESVFGFTGFVSY
ncbi:hypothetical protein L6452_02426 [Arctium lappa]|uniref:Uncharacterized protein n=1 Tax=Arctium lappa TaxID=4217 RepID=A0ACB9FKN4_ARCLA|nr:hypothetical protein L6452_02426 [Arctium lappa]